MISAILVFFVAQRVWAAVSSAHVLPAKPRVGRHKWAGKICIYLFFHLYFLALEHVNAVLSAGAAVAAKKTRSTVTETLPAGHPSKSQRGKLRSPFVRRSEWHLLAIYTCTCFMTLDRSRKSLRGVRCLITERVLAVRNSCDRRTTTRRV